MIKLEQKTQLDRKEILKIYTKGYKKPEDYRIGIEFERLPISATSFKAIDYWSDNGIKTF